MDAAKRMSCVFFFSSRRRHTRYWRDWSSDVCSSDLTAAAAGELLGASVGDRDTEYPGVSHNYLLEVLRRVVVESRREAEAAEQGLSHEPCAGSGTHEGEVRDVHPYRARRRSLAEHDVHSEILHRRVEDLLDLPVQAVDLVYKQEVALLERGQDRRHVPRPLQARTARGS